MTFIVKKSILERLYIDEFTVFIKVKIASLNELSKSIPKIVNKDETKNKDKIKTIIDRKYLYRSDWSTIVSEKAILFIYMCLGLVWERSSLMENLIRLNIFKNLIPELVEKNDPPIITKIINKKDKFVEKLLIDIPMFDTLLTIEKLKNEDSIRKEKNIFLISEFKIISILLDGINPPDEIIVIARFKESNVLKLIRFKTKKINIVRKV